MPENEKRTTEEEMIEILKSNKKLTFDNMCKSYLRIQVFLRDALIFMKKLGVYEEFVSRYTQTIQKVMDDILVMIYREDK